MRFSQRHPSPPLFESRWIRHRSPPIIRLWTLLVCGPSGSSNLVFGHTDGARELAAPRRRAHGADLQPRPSSRVAGNRRGWGWALVLAPAFLCVPTPAGPPVGARRSNPGHPPGWPAISEAGGGPLCSPLPFFVFRPRQVHLSGLGDPTPAILPGGRQSPRLVEGPCARPCLSFCSDLGRSACRDSARAVEGVSRLRVHDSFPRFSIPAVPSGAAGLLRAQVGPGARPCFSFRSSLGRATCRGHRGVGDRSRTICCQPRPFFLGRSRFLASWVGPSRPPTSGSAVMLAPTNRRQQRPAKIPFSLHRVRGAQRPSAAPVSVLLPEQAPGIQGGQWEHSLEQCRIQGECWPAPREAGQ